LAASIGKARGSPGCATLKRQSVHKRRPRTPANGSCAILCFIKIWLFYYDSDRGRRPSAWLCSRALTGDKQTALKLPERGDAARQQQWTLSAARAGLQAESAAARSTFSTRKTDNGNYDLRAETDADCTAWVEAIKNSRSWRSERLSKWHYVKQTEELMAEVAQLRKEVRE
uniref:PH domain-containing protein n=1 Tax=Macrostomum lignano TaxID=282301 RepID=A0A1I8FCN0_9PLAT